MPRCVRTVWNGAAPGEEVFVLGGHATCRGCGEHGKEGANDVVLVFFFGHMGIWLSSSIVKPR